MTDRSTEPQHTILLVEDSDIDAELIGIHLQRAGLNFEFKRARNRAEFLRELSQAGSAQAPLDLVLADYSLPDIDGVTVLQLAKAGLPGLPVVLVSGIGGEDLVTDALRRGATDYVMKRNLTRLSGAVTRALAETRERNQRTRAEDALVKSEAKMRLALDAATLGLWHYGGGEEMGCDDRCAAMLGIEPGGVTYAGFLQLAHPADRDGLDQALQLAMADETAPSLAHQCRFVAPDGAVHWIVLRGRRLDMPGGTTRMSGVMQDVTATRVLESQQRHTELLFKLATQATGLGIWEIGPGPDEAWFDAGYRSLAGLPEGGSSTLSALLDEVVHREDRATVQAALARGTQDGADDVKLEHRIHRPIDGQLRWVAVQGRRIVGIDGLPRLVGTARDITEQRRLQDLLERSNEELERRVADRTRELTSEIAERSRVEDTLQQMQRLEAVGQLTSGVAHDFNNLLTVVLSNISLITRLLQQQAAPDERVLKRLGSMRDAANRGATLTKQLLAFSRRQRLAPQTISFNDIVLGMRDLLQTTLGGSVHLETELAEDAWQALVDPTQMELIILNLAINARDAMEVGGHLRVRTANMSVTAPPSRPEEPEVGDYVVLSVSDTGTGMSDEVLAKAFEPFFTTKEVGKGSGLGLAQVFGFAKQSGGGVRIETRLGEGSTVHVFMPRSHGDGKASAAADLDVADATRASDGRRHTVLLVDDDHAVREASASLLEVLGYQVEQASSASQALQRLQQAQGIDLVIADFAMPKMNGAEMAAQIRQQHPHLPVVFLTGYAELSVPQHVPNSYLLQKPVHESELVACLEEALNAGASRQR